MLTWPRGSTAPHQLRRPPPPAALASGNLLGGSGFEEMTKYSFALHNQTVASSDVAHSGQASACLGMRDDPAEATGATVYYLVQEVNRRNLLS